MLRCRVLPVFASAHDENDSHDAEQSHTDAHDDGRHRRLRQVVEALGENYKDIRCRLACV